MKSLKLISYPREKVTDCCAAILVDSGRLQISGAFKPDNLGYINHIFEDTSDSRFHIQDIQKYKEVTEFIKNFYVCDINVMSPEYLIAYESLVQKATCEYRNLFEFKAVGTFGKHKY